MKIQRVIVLVGAASAGVSIAICILALLGSGVLVSPSQASRLSPLADPPVTFLTGTWPAYASDALSADPYPPRPGEPVKICAVLVNHHATLVFTPTVEIGVANFGIGTPFVPIDVSPLAVPPSGQASYCITWVPPIGGDFNIHARLSLAGYADQTAMRSLDADEPLLPNTPHSRVFIVANPTSSAATIVLGMIPHQAGWTYQLSQDVFSNMPPFATRPVTLTVTPSTNLPAGDPTVVDVEGYIGANLIGGFRKIYHPPVILHQGPDPSYAESEISINPYPPREREPTEICASLENNSPVSQQVTVTLSVASFGIGTPFHDIVRPISVAIAAYSQKKVCVTWVPPFGGLFNAGFRLDQPGFPTQYSQRNMDVGEPLTALFPHARLFQVVNSESHNVTYTLSTIPRLPGWGIQLSDHVLANLSPGESRMVTLTVTPPYNLPPEGAPIVDVEARQNGVLVGGFRKLYTNPVPLHRPQDPVYAESEIQVNPYPPRAGEPVRISAELRNPSDIDRQVQVQFGVAPFGIGQAFMPLYQPVTVTIPAGGLRRPSVLWVAPSAGLWCFQIELHFPGIPTILRSQRNMDMGEPLEPLVPHSRQFVVANTSDKTVTYTLGLVPHLPDWSMSLSPDVLKSIAPGGQRIVTLTVTAPPVLPPEGAPIVDVEAYQDGALVGGFRKLYTPPVPVHQPGEPVYAESEIGIDPYPVLAGKPAKLSVLLHNPADIDRTVNVRFEWAQFGIGLPFYGSGVVPVSLPVFIPAHGAAIGNVLWTPPPGFQGKICVRVWVDVPGHASIWSQRNIDIGEPLVLGVSHTQLFQLGATGYTRTVTVNLGLTSYRPDWIMTVTPSQTVLNPGQIIQASLVVSPPVGARLGAGDLLVDVEAYVSGALLGGFRKLDVPPVSLHKPFEPGYAESEIQVYPWPPQVGHSSLVSATVQNSSDQPMTVDLAFGWAQFGMGIPFSTTGMAPITRTVTLNPAEVKVASVQWTPKTSGHQCLRVLLHDHAGRYLPQQSQRNVDVVDHTICGEKDFSFTLQNSTALTVTVTIGSSAFNLPPGWTYLVSPPGPFVLKPYESIPLQLKVFIPCQTAAGEQPDAVQTALPDIRALQQAAQSWPTIDVEGIANGGLVGGIQVQFSPLVLDHPLFLPAIRK